MAERILRAEGIPASSRSAFQCVVTATTTVVSASKGYDAYHIARVGNRIFIDGKRVHALARNVIDIMRNRDKFVNLKCLMYVGLGHRTRLPGGGRSRCMPDGLDSLLRVRMKRLTMEDGGYSDEVFNIALLSYAKLFKGVEV